MALGALNTVTVLASTSAEIVRTAEADSETLLVTFENTHTTLVTVELYGWSDDIVLCRRLHTFELTETGWSAGWFVKLAKGATIFAKASVANVVTVAVEEDTYSE